MPRSPPTSLGRLAVNAAVVMLLLAVALHAGEQFARAAARPGPELTRTRTGAQGASFFVSYRYVFHFIYILPARARARTQEAG